MKKILFYLSIFIISSCSENYDIEPDKCFDNSSLSTRSIVNSENASVTNPDFINNWENMSSIVLNSSKPGMEKIVSLPWAAAVSSALPENVSKDVKKEDGWRMLMHTFKNYGTDEKQNYFVLYNDFTGVLRVYYFNEIMPEANNTFMWNVKTSNSSPDYILGSNIYPVKALDVIPLEKTIKLSNYSINEYSSLSYGWNSFELPLTYFATNQNNEYLISAINANITDIKLMGTSKGTINGKIVSTTSTGNKLIEGAANLSKDASKEYLVKLLDAGNTVGFASKVRKGIADIVSGAVKDGVKGGLKYLFGNIFQSGVEIKNFDVNLTTKTTMELSGTSGFPSVGQVVPLNNIDLKKYNGGVNLGAWNLEKTPKVTYNKYSPVTLLYGEHEGSIDQNSPLPGVLLVNAPDIQYEKPNIVVNPKIQKYLKKQSVTYELINSLKSRDSGEIYHSDLLNFLARDESKNFGRLYYNEESNISVYSLLKPMSFYDDVYQTMNGLYLKDFHLVYDWSGTEDDTFMLAVTVDQTFDFNGKEIQITSSKHFKTEFSMMSAWYYIYPTSSGFGPSYVVNKDQVLW